MIRNSINLKERNINVAIKADTKDALDKLGSRRDSYDDIIRKIIRVYYQKQDLEEHNKNLIKVTDAFKRKKATIGFGDVEIEYSFNIPRFKELSDYDFNIHYYKVLVKDKEVSDIYDYSDSPEELAKDYLKIIERIIQLYIDPIFKIRRNNRNLLDLSWWERKFNSLGLSYDTFKKDVKDRLVHFGVVA